MRARRVLLRRRGAARHGFREIAVRLLHKKDAGSYAERGATVAVTSAVFSPASAASVPPHAPLCPLHDPSHRFVAAGAFERNVLADIALRSSGFIVARQQGAHISRASLRAELHLARAAYRRALLAAARNGTTATPAEYSYQAAARVSEL